MALLRRNLTLALGLVLAFAGLPPARLRAAQPDDETPARVLRFYYVSFSTVGERNEADAVARFLIRNDDANTALRLAANAFSPAIRYRGPVPVPLFREMRTEEGLKREDLGRLEFPAEWKGVLFLVTPNPSDPVFPFRFYPVEYWAPSIPENHLRLINLTARDLAVKLGDRQAFAPSRQALDLGLPPAAEFPMRIALQRPGRWDMLLSTAIAAPRRQNRLLMLAIPKSADGSARILSIQDLPEPPPAQ